MSPKANGPSGSIESLDARLAAALAGCAEPSSALGRQQAFLRAAAVLWRFAPDLLQPDDDEPARPHEATELLVEHVTRLRIEARIEAQIEARIEPDQPSWTLRDALRPALLAGLDAGALARLRARYPGPVGPEQALVDRWLAGADPDLEHYDLDQLAVLTRLRDWFDPPPPHLPTAGDLERLRSAARLRAALRRLIGRKFYGREAELASVEDFVVRPAEGDPALMVISGLSGVGKSTLVAKLALDVMAECDPAHVVSYLDFDEPTLDIGDGVSVVLEIATHAAAQRPDVPLLQQIAARAMEAAADLASGRGRAPGRSLAVRASTLELADALGRAFAGNGVERVVLVLDTFEEIQYANVDHQRFLQELLATLDARMPSLRTLLVTRARVDMPGASYLELGELEPAAARVILAAHGVTAEAPIEAALEVARGNPLSLQLAAEVLRRAGEAGPTDLLGQHDAPEQALVQGELYQRILQHLDRDVRQLAHPGLVARRVTPEIIRDVLAGPCGLGPLEDEQARELFGRLAREGTFVQRADDGAVEHRPEVRRVMLRLLHRDQPVVAREIHARAAAYHAARADEISIAEEAYHRFALGETDGPWLDRLTARAAARLRGALEELPESCWPTLASYAGIDLPPERWAAATDAARERRLAARLGELLARDRAEEAVALLAEQPPRRPNSPLWRWQGRAFALVGRLPEALEALRSATTTMLGPPHEAREDLRLAAELAAKLGEREGADRAEPSTGFRWLDDLDLRQLIREAIGDGRAPARAAPGGAIEHTIDERPTERSTRAARIYAEAVTLNQTRERGNGSIPLLEWMDRLAHVSAPTIAKLKSRILGRPLPPKGKR